MWALARATDVHVNHSDSINFNTPFSFKLSKISKIRCSKSFNCLASEKNNKQIRNMAKLVIKNNSVINKYLPSSLPLTFLLFIPLNHLKGEGSL